MFVGFGHVGELLCSVRAVGDERTEIRNGVQ